MIYIQSLGDDGQGSIVSEYSDGLAALLNKRGVTRTEVLREMVMNLAPVRVQRLIGGLMERIGEGKEIRFGLLTDVWRAQNGTVLEEGLLMLNPDEDFDEESPGSDMEFCLKVWYID